MQAVAAVGHEALNKAQAHGRAANSLSIAIVGFARDVTIATPEPIDDLSQAASLASGIGEEAADSPLTFTAVSKAVEEFLAVSQQRLRDAVRDRRRRERP